MKNRNNRYFISYLLHMHYIIKAVFMTSFFRYNLSIIWGYPIIPKIYLKRQNAALKFKNMSSFDYKFPFFAFYDGDKFFSRSIIKNDRKQNICLRSELCYIWLYQDIIPFQKYIRHSYFLKIRVELFPPKPNEFEAAAFISFFIASLGI